MDMLIGDHDIGRSLHNMIHVDRAAHAISELAAHIVLIHNTHGHVL